MDGQNRADPLPRAKNGKIDWLAYIRTAWPIIVGLVALFVWFDKRLESPEEKQRRINAAVVPLDLHLKRIDVELRTLAIEHKGHIKQGGHAVMENRMSSMERKMDKMEDNLPEIMRLLQMLVQNGTP